MWGDMYKGGRGGGVNSRDLFMSSGARSMCQRYPVIVPILWHLFCSPFSGKLFARQTFYEGVIKI